MSWVVREACTITSGLACLIHLNNGFVSNFDSEGYLKVIWVIYCLRKFHFVTRKKIQVGNDLADKRLSGLAA